MANREREIQLKFRVTPEERELIEAKMAQLGTQNMAAYLRKMAPGWVCGPFGTAGASGDGIPAAPEQQQPKPAHPARP